jgi:hypothetical protein
MLVSLEASAGVSQRHPYGHQAREPERAGLLVVDSQAWDEPRGSTRWRWSFTQPGKLPVPHSSAFWVIGLSL